MNISNRLRCIKKDLKALADQVANASDLDEQTLNVNCDTGKLEISNGNDVDLDQLGNVTVYRLAANVSPGVINREWHDTKPAIPIADSTTAAGREFRLCHDFSLPTTTNTIVNGLNLNDTDNTGGELDVQVNDTVITVPTGGIWVQYQGGSEGYWAIEVGYCCGPLQLEDELGYQDREDNLAIVGPVFLPEGQHNFRAWNIDSGGSNSSHQIRYSTDGDTFVTAVPTGVEFSTEKRGVDCQLIEACDLEAFQDVGWDVCPPADCLAPVVDPQPVEPAVVVQPGSIVPIPDNDDDLVRVGNAGFSDDYARADHSHSIRRQANPGAPTLTAGGNATIVQALTTSRFWSDEEAVYFGQRYRMQQPVGTGWGWLGIPLIAGFQRPIVVDLNSYRLPSTAVQDDDGANGAGPRGPYMGGEVSQWSFTNRLYGAYFRRDNPVDMYITVVLKYIRS